MKKYFLLLISICLILVLVMTACTSTSGQTVSDTTTSGSSDPQGNSALSQVNMLLVGTLKLEDTGQSVTADEAATLLPLWQAYRSLSISQTSAEAEVEALLNQIQSTMTADQVQTITAMNLTATDMIDLMQSMGGVRMGRGTPDPQSTPGFDIPSGGFEGSVPPSGDFQIGAGGPPSGSTEGSTRNLPSGGGMVITGGGPGGDAAGDAGLGGGQMIQGTPDPSMQATAQARFSTQANQVNSILLDVLIGKLQAKTTE
jgi:hypothetical protein